MNVTQIATLKKNYGKDLDINKRISKFKEQLKNEHVYRIPLRYFTDLGKINFPTKIDYRIKLHLEKDMKGYSGLERYWQWGRLFLCQMQKLYLLKPPTSSMNKFYWIKILGSILKQ